MAPPRGCLFPDLLVRLSCPPSELPQNSSPLWRCRDPQLTLGVVSRLCRSSTLAHYRKRSPQISSIEIC